MSRHLELFYKKLSEARERLAYVPRALRLIWRAASWWTVAWFVLLAVQGTLPAATVYLTKLLVDAVVEAMQIGPSWEGVSILLWPSGLMGLTLLLSNVIKGVVQYVQTGQSELVEDHIKGRIHDQAIRVDMAFYESSDYHDQLHQASSEASNRSLELIQNLGSLLKNGVTLVAISGVLMSYALWLPVVLVVSTLPALYVVVWHNIRHHAWWERTTDERRRAKYYDMLLTYDFPAAEMRLFDLGTHFKEAYQSVRKRLRNERLELERDETMARLGAGLTAVVITGAIMVWMVWRALQGLLTMGDLALFYQAFNRGQGLMRGALSSAGKIYTCMMFLEHLFTYLEIEPDITDPAEPLPVPGDLDEGIRFRDVTFRYPETERAALENFDLFIPAGKTVAVVGANGAGKSTLLKLLCRFYDPESGAVEVDGVDLRRFRPAEWRQQITTLFQSPMRYQATAKKNIVMGDLSTEPAPGDLERAGEQAMIHQTIEGLPDGYDTQLGKWFEHGTELSGGQWRRITLARAFYREAPIVVLDEPTSSMDSWAENRWLDQFVDLVRDQTALIITHRFTTAMCADTIHVMDSGRVIETGSHEDLLAVDGRYASSWRAQVQRRTEESRVA